MRKSISLFIALFLLITIFTFNCWAEYPEKDISGIIMWSAGGETDKVARTITPLAEEELGQSIILQNKPGASGALSMQFVRSAPAEGYTILYGSQDPLLHKVLNIADFDYLDHFYPVLLFFKTTPVIVVEKDSPYKTMEDLIEAAKEKPGKIQAATGGTGTLPFTIYALMKEVHGVTFNEIPFKGTGPCLTALMGGHVELMGTSNAATYELYRGNKVRVLSVINKERLPEFPDIPAITEIYPEYEKYLPWGTFMGVYARKNIPEERKEILTNAFKKAYKKDKFQEYISNNGLTGMGIFGEEANEFIQKYQSVTSWLVHNAGASKVSPEEFGIPRP